MIHANGVEVINCAHEAYKIALAGSSGMAKRHCTALNNALS